MRKRSEDAGKEGEPVENGAGGAGDDLATRESDADDEEEDVEREIRKRCLPPRTASRDRRPEQKAEVAADEPILEGET